MKLWVPSCLVLMAQAVGRVVMVCGIFSWFTLVPLIPTKDYLNAADYLGIFVGHVPQFMTIMHPSSGHYIQQDNLPCHKSRIVPFWFMGHSNMSKWSLQSMDHNSLENLWHVVEREIWIMGVQPSNLEELWDVIIIVCTYFQLPLSHYSH